MKYFRQFLLLLLCFVFVFSAFSISANAEEINTDNVGLTFNLGWYTTKYGQSSGFRYTYSATNKFNHVYSTTDARTFSLGGDESDPDNYIYFATSYRLESSDGSMLIKKGQSFSVTLNNLYTSFYCYNLQKEYPWKKLDDSTFAVIYSDGSTDYFDLEFEFNSHDNTHNVSFSGVAEKDIKVIVAHESWYPVNRLGDYFKGDTTWRIDYGTKSFDFQLDIQSEEAGLLSQIKGFTSSIKNGVSQMISQIKNLPQNIWNVFSEGLKNLFVPDEQYMAGYKDKWDQLLSSRLGAVYQVGDITLNSWDSIMAADQTNSIDIPSVSIPLPDGNSFVFGGYTVPIVPSGFDGLVNSLKVIVGIVCTYLFVNGLLKRYDEVMGVET